MNKEQSLNVELLVTNYFIPLEFHQFKQAFIIELLQAFIIEFLQEFLIELL